MSVTTMIEAIKDDLGYLKLHRSAEIFAELAEGDQRDDRLEFLAALVAEEATATRQRRLNARLRFAHFPTRRTIEELDFDFQPSVDPTLIGDLAGLGFVEAGAPILLLGKPGCAKSHLAIALGIRAVEAGYRGYFTTATDMVAAMTTAYADGSFNNKIRTYTGPSVLVIDDVGITPFDRNQANAFFQVVNRRYENRSATIVTTNHGLPKAHRFDRTCARWRLKLTGSMRRACRGRRRQRDRRGDRRRSCRGLRRRAWDRG